MVITFSVMAVSDGSGFYLVFAHRFQRRLWNPDPQSLAVATRWRLSQKEKGERKLAYQVVTERGCSLPFRQTARMG